MRSGDPLAVAIHFKPDLFGDNLDRAGPQPYIPVRFDRIGTVSKQIDSESVTHEMLAAIDRREGPTLVLLSINTMTYE